MWDEVQTQPLAEGMEVINEEGETETVALHPDGYWTLMPKGLVYAECLEELADMLDQAFYEW
jgi:hypothetical protein